MGQHKPILVFLTFVILFVQNGLYFSGSQLSLRESEKASAVYGQGEEDGEVSSIIPLTLKEMDLFWIKEKRMDPPLADFSEGSTYGEDTGQEKEICREIKKMLSEQQEKYSLAAGLRSPPDTDPGTEKQQKQNTSK